MSGRNKIIFLVSAFLASSIALPASSLFVGFNTATPVQVYSLTGSYQQDLGPAGGIAALSDSSGNYFAVIPTASSSTVAEYNSSMAQIGSFTLSNLITDTGSDAGNLLFSAYDGTVYRTTVTGSILNSWNTGYTHVGVASDGTNIYTTRGDAGNLIDIWSSSGTNLGQIATPFTGLYGLAYDSATGDFWAGSTNYVYQLSASGNLIASFDLMGDSRTPNGAVHDGLEIGDISVTPPPPTVAPEPASLLLMLLGAIGIFSLRKLASARKLLARLLGGAAAFACVSFGSVSVTLTSSPGSGAPVGTPVTWTAKASDSSNPSASFRYQFTVAPSGGATQVVKDWAYSNTLGWAPSVSEGVYDVQVNVASSTGATGFARGAFTVSSRVTGSSPVVSRTRNPLVALYSMPPCPAGHTARVRFKLPSNPVWQTTSVKACNGSNSLNFYIAGMRGNTTYQLQHDVFNGPFNTPGPVLSFTTGAVPAGAIPDAYSVVKAPVAPNNTAYPVLFTGPTNAGPYALDSNGQVIWYLPTQAERPISSSRVVPGGTFYQFNVNYGGNSGNLLREYDMAGNVVRETNSAAISARLVARGDDPITSLHHETVRLPNGWIAFLGSSERIADQGKGPVDVLGDQVIVTDSNFNVKWFWNEFDHLDVMRPAVLGETCRANQGGCPPITKPGYTQANDWTHTNSIYPTPDGNLIISIRHQDWIVKIRYANGTGDGAILWRFGRDGDFSTSASDPFPWPSHQHDAEFTPGGLLTLFDNGNTRISMFGGNSRAQAWKLDESRRVATRVTNLDLGAFSNATGNTQLLSNGNYFVDMGFVNNVRTEQKELTPSGGLAAQVNTNHSSYRSFRLRSLSSGQ